MRHLTISLFVFTCLVAASVLFLGIEAKAIVFDDGQVHLIDANNSFPAEAVTVADGPGGATTTVILIPGGEIGTAPGVGGELIATGTSVVNVSGGISRGVVLRDSSVGTISGTRAVLI